MHLQGAAPALLTPSARLLAGDCLLQGNPCCSTPFFQNASRSHLHGQLGRRGRCGAGRAERLKFSKAGEPQLVLALRQGDSLLG